jgi:hypothetical protein
MDSATPPPPKRGSLDILLKIVHQPTHLRLAVAATLLGAWYMAVYSPIVGQIDEVRNDLAEQTRKLGLAGEVQGLRREADRVKDRFIEGADRNGLSQLLIEGVRAIGPLRLTTLEPRDTIEVGPYKAAVFYLVVRGTYQDVERLLRWLESSPKLLRIDQIRLMSQDKSTAAARAANPGTEVEMQVNLTGILG